METKENNLEGFTYPYQRPGRKAKSSRPFETPTGWGPFGLQRELHSRQQPPQQKRHAIRIPIDGIAYLKEFRTHQPCQIELETDTIGDRQSLKKSGPVPCLRVFKSHLDSDFKNHF